MLAKLLPEEGEVAFESPLLLLRRKRLPMSPKTDTVISLVAAPPAVGVLLCLKGNAKKNVINHSVAYIEIDNRLQEF